MAKGYYTDTNGRPIGYWELPEKPQDTEGFRFIETDNQPVIASGGEVKKPIDRLAEIDALVGPRPVREYLLSIGVKGFGNKIETLEQEAALLRAQL